MKKPTRPRHPVLPLFQVGVYSRPRSQNYIKVTHMSSRALELAVKMLGLPAEELDAEHCYFRKGAIYYDLGQLDPALVKRDFDSETYKKVLAFHKRMAAYRKKMRQYEINLNVYKAWQLKQKKDRLLDEMKILEKHMSELQSKVDDIDHSIEEKLADEAE